jgi:hypothetical protein
MQLIPEDLLKNILSSEIQAINKDPKFLVIREIYEEVELNQPELKGITEEVIKCWKKEPPIVDHTLHWAYVQKPGIYIDYGQESDDQDIGMNQHAETGEETAAHGRPGIYWKTLVAFNVPSMVVWIMTSNPFWTRHLFLIAKTLIIRNVPAMASKGLINMRMSGGNIDRMTNFLPDILFPKQITLTFTYGFETKQFESVPLGESLSAKYEEPEDGGLVDTNYPI